ncbi:MAG TPA: CoA-binding protein [Bacteroidia bacterium]|nr:CoA-binding protein [Bacteroidia bacterium]
MKLSESDKKTLVLGASLNPSRYSNLAIRRLRSHHIEVEAVGLVAGVVDDVTILTGTPALENIHTVTLYMRAERQAKLYDYILSLKPSRIIFNPGAENAALAALAVQYNIEPLEACTLVMLSTGIY